MAALVQSVSATGASSPVSLTLPNPTTAGSCLIVCASGNSSGTDPVVTGVTLGGAAGNFAQAVTVGNSGTDFALTSQWADPNCAGGQTAVSVAFSSTGTPVLDVTVMEWSGIVPSSPVDKTAAQVNSSGSSSWSSTATATTTQAFEVAIGCVGGFNAGSIGTITGPGAPWTNLTQVTSGGGSFGLLTGYQVLSSTGTVTYSGTFAGSSDYAAAVATYKAVPGTQDMPQIAPGPLWFGHFKPGMPRPRPTRPDATSLDQATVAAVIPAPVTSISGTVVRPQDVPEIQPGPSWLRRFKPGKPKPLPVLPYALSGEAGALNLVVPAPVTSLSGTVVRPQDVPAVAPGPSWLRRFKPGRPRPVPPAPPSPPVRLLQGSLSLVLPPPFTVISSQELRQPENLGAVLSLPSPDGAAVETTEGATCTLADYGATLVLPGLGASLIGWTMQTAPLNLLEFNDVTIDIAIVQNGSPYNLAGVTVNLLFKTAAGTPDANALTFSSGGISPAITVTNAAGGLAVAVIPNGDLDNEVYFFYRLDVVAGGLTNTCLSGPITWTSL